MVSLLAKNARQAARHRHDRGASIATCSGRVFPFASRVAVWAPQAVSSEDYRAEVRGGPRANALSSSARSRPGASLALAIDDRQPLLGNASVSARDSRARLQPLALKLCLMFVELDTRKNHGLSVSLEWDRDTGETQIIVQDDRTANILVFGVNGASAADAFRHPFRYLP